jgi:hypothetical protein
VESDGIDLVSVETENGPIDIRAGGAVIAQSVISTTDHADNDISILTTAGDLQVQVIDAGTLGHVALTSETGAVNDASATDAAVNVKAYSAALTAKNGIGSVCRTR